MESPEGDGLLQSYEQVARGLMTDQKGKALADNHDGVLLRRLRGFALDASLGMWNGLTSKPSRSLLLSVELGG